MTMTTTLRFTPLYLTYQSPFSLSSYLTLPSPLPPLPATYSSTHFDIFRELRPARSSRKSILRWLEGVLRTTFSLALFHPPFPPPSRSLLLGPEPPNSTADTPSLLRLRRLFLLLLRPPLSLSLSLSFSFIFLFFFSFFLRFFCLSFFQGERTERRERRIDSSFREVCNEREGERERQGRQKGGGRGCMCGIPRGS